MARNLALRVLIIGVTTFGLLGGVALAGLEPCPPQPEPLDSSDALIILQYEAGLADQAPAWADINMDSAVDSVDALFVLWLTADTIGGITFCIN